MTLNCIYLITNDVEHIFIHLLTIWTYSLVKCLQKTLVHFWGKESSNIHLFLLIYRSYSVQFSLSVVSDSLQPHESQHTRPPSPSPTPGVHSNSCPLSRWCHPAISSTVIPFSSCPQSLPASESSPMSQLFAWGGQSTGVSASASLLPKNTQDWSPLEWTGWISLHQTKCKTGFTDVTLGSAGGNKQGSRGIGSPGFLIF